MKQGILFATLLLAGCSSLSQLTENKKVDYRTSAILPSLEVPPDLTQPGSDERYVVPDATPQASATYSAYTKERTDRPQASSAANNFLPTLEKARVERAGSERWLVVRDTSEAVWPVVKRFWQNAGFVVSKEIPEAGIMETDWAENRAKIAQGGLREIIGKVLDSVYSSSERDKFRARLERGSEPGTTEVYISHRSMVEVYVSEGKDQTKWQPRPPDPEMEAEMLRRLMMYFGVEETHAQVQVAAEAAVRAKLQPAADGASSLALTDGFDRAWRRVGLALDRIGFTVEDRDRSQGVYFVRYADPEAENRQQTKGLLSKLKFWESATPATTKPVQYRIRVGEAGAGSVVSVLTQDGAPEKTEIAGRILGLLHAQLK